MARFNFVAITFVLLASALVTTTPEALAQSTSSEVTEVTRGVGFRQTNKFEFKYKERIKTYEDQIQMGLKRGWLSSEDAEIFTSRLAKLKEMEASVSANNYPKPALDNLEQEITKFNKEFSDAGQKQKSTPVTTPAAVESTKAPVSKPATAKPKAQVKTSAKTVNKKSTKAK